MWIRNEVIRVVVERSRETKGCTEQSVISCRAQEESVALIGVNIEGEAQNVPVSRRFS